MYDDENTNEDLTKDERNVCPKCGLRQYGSVCASCNIEIEGEEDPDKKKEDEYDEYDWRERR